MEVDREQVLGDLYTDFENEVRVNFTVRDSVLSLRVTYSLISALVSEA
jgi:hypothetical protein